MFSYGLLLRVATISTATEWTKVCPTVYINVGPCTGVRTAVPRNQLVYGYSFGVLIITELFSPCRTQQQQQQQQQKA